VIRVKKDWWKDYFDNIYLITDARSVADPHLTKREVSLVERLLNLKKDDSILDLCGGEGRHALELARRGYKHLTVLDYSKYLIARGRETAKKQRLHIRFSRKDARKTGLEKKRFSAVMIMANSFGYFDHSSDDIRLLRETKRILAKGGRLLLDLTDADYVRKNIAPVSKHRTADGTTIERHRQLRGNLIKAREIVTSSKKGTIRDGSYSERLYTPRSIKKLLKQMGFKDVSIYKGISLHKKKKDYGFLTSRMMVKAIK